MAISFSTEAGLAGNYPSRRYNKRERSLFSSIKTYVDAQIQATDEVVEDTSPTLGGHLDVGAFEIISAAGLDIDITPDTTGNLILDGLKWPQADAGGSGQVLTSDGAAQLSWTVAPALVGGSAIEQTAFSIRDGNVAYDLAIASDDASMAADRILSIDVNNAARRIDLSDNLTVSASSGTLDQSVAAGSSPAFTSAA
jgi:hypothetical protein